MPSGILSQEEDKGYSEYKARPRIHKMINMESPGIRRPDRLDNKPKKNGLFSKLLLALVGAREVDKNDLHISNQRKTT